MTRLDPIFTHSSKGEKSVFSGKGAFRNSLKGWMAVSFVSGKTDPFMPKRTCLGNTKDENITCNVRKMVFNMAGNHAAVQDFVKADKETT